MSAIKLGTKVYLTAKWGDKIQKCEYVVVEHHKNNVYKLKSTSVFTEPRVRTIVKVKKSKKSDKNKPQISRGVAA